jgi:hypothetical protein
LVAVIVSSETYVDSVGSAFLGSFDECVKNRGRADEASAANRSACEGETQEEGVSPIVGIGEDWSDGFVKSHCLSISHRNATALVKSVVYYYAGVLSILPHR